MRSTSICTRFVVDELVLEVSRIYIYLFTITFQLLSIYSILDEDFASGLLIDASHLYVLCLVQKVRM